MFQLVVVAVLILIKDLLLLLSLIALNLFLGLKSQAHATISLRALGPTAPTPYLITGHVHLGMTLLER